MDRVSAHQPSALTLSPLPTVRPWLSASAGVSSADFSNLTAVLDAVPAISWITLDVANGYSEVCAAAGGGGWGGGWRPGRASH